MGPPPPKNAICIRKYLFFTLDWSKAHMDKLIALDPCQKVPNKREKGVGVRLNIFYWCVYFDVCSIKSNWKLMDVKYTKKFRLCIPADRHPQDYITLGEKTFLFHILFHVFNSYLVNCLTFWMIYIDFFSTIEILFHNLCGLHWIIQFLETLCFDNKI